MSKISDDVKALLDEHDWDDTIPRLIKYALNKIRGLTWYQEPGGHVAAGKMAEDFVMDAVVKVYTGQRQWDPQAVPDLLTFMFGVVRSEISHHSNSLENRCLHFLDALSPNTRKAAEQAGPDDNEPGFINGFLNEFRDDPRMAKVVALAAAGRKPRDIAAELSISITDIYNMRKVICRRLENYLVRIKDRP